MRYDLKKVIVTIIYCMIYISAVIYMRLSISYPRVLLQFYYYTNELVILLSLTYITIHVMIKRCVKIDHLVILLLSIIGYELMISLLNGLFVLPIILVDVMVWPLVFLVFYIYSSENEFPKLFKIITFVGMIVVCVSSIPNLREHILHFNGGAVFATYYCIAFLPLIYHFNSRKMGVIFSAIVGAIMLASTKRAGLIITVVGVMLYYFVLDLNTGTIGKKVRRLFVYLISAVAVFMLGRYLIEKFNLSIVDRISSMIEDGGSGRTRLWEEIITYYNNSSLMKKLLGHGFHAVFYQIKPLGIARYAHNSFLETLYDYGIIGLSLIIVLVLRIIAYTAETIRLKQEAGSIMAFCLAPTVILGSVSYFFEEAHIIVPICIVWGILMGKRNYTVANTIDANNS